MMFGWVCDLSFTLLSEKKGKKRERALNLKFGKTWIIFIVSLSVYYRLYPFSAGYHKYTLFLTAPSI